MTEKVIFQLRNSCLHKKSLQGKYNKLKSDTTEAKMSVHKKCKMQTRKKLNWTDVETSESSSYKISYSSDSSFSFFYIY